MVTFLNDKSEVAETDYYISYRKIANVLPALSYNIFGRPMRVAITCDKIEDAINIKRDYMERDDLVLYVIVNENIFKKLQGLYPSDVVILSKWDLLLSMIADTNLHFAKGCIGVLYNAVDNKSKEGFREAIDILLANFPIYHEITAEDIGKYFYVQEAVFPRQVLLAFLQRKKNRWKLFRACERFYPSSMIYYAMRDNLDKFIEAKGLLYSTGKRDKIVSFIHSKNLAMMKRVFLLPIKDPFVILKLYEGGFTTDDTC